jgi:kynureninase
MDRLREKSLRLTAYLEHLLLTEIGNGGDSDADKEKGREKEFTIFTPSEPSQRGCQLSLSFTKDVEAVNRALLEAGVICDVRKPDVMRVAPAPLYNSYCDVYDFVIHLKCALASL